jgi:hypothetical protein
MPAPWSTAGPLSALATLLGTLTTAGLQEVFVGVPESFGRQVSSYVTLGEQVIINKTTGGGMQRRMAYRVVIGYMVDGAEATAEATVAAILDAFLDAIFDDRTLGGTLEQIEVDASEAAQPRYVGVAGSIAREYPIRITGVQRKAFPVN